MLIKSLAVYVCFPHVNFGVLNFPIFMRTMQEPLTEEEIEDLISELLEVESKVLL